MKLCAIEIKELEDKALTRFAENQNDELLEDLSDYVINSQKEIERLNNIINELENLVKEDIISNLCEIENKRIGYGQTEVDKIWLHNLWGFKKSIISKCNEILKESNKK